MHVQAETVVGIAYTLKNDQGEVVDESSHEEPLYYLHGHGNIVEGLEEQLEGKNEGDHVVVSVPPEKGYGHHDEQRIQRVPRTELPKDLNPQRGMTLFMRAGEHQLPVRITKVGPTSITVDGNHELAGQTLHFDVTVKEVRRATDDEIAHGHAHGPNDHHHH